MLWSWKMPLSVATCYYILQSFPGHIMACSVLLIMIGKIFPFCCGVGEWSRLCCGLVGVACTGGCGVNWQPFVTSILSSL